MRKILIGFVLVTVVAAIAFLHVRSHRAKAAVEKVYAGNRQVILWSTTAQVREPVATINFGEPLDVLGRFGDQTEVRTASGIIGWADRQSLLSAEFWQKAQDLSAQVSTLPVEASGHTKVLANLHAEPGRESTRIRQLNKGLSVELFERKSVEIPEANPRPSAAEPAPENRGKSSSSSAEPRKEDWWLIRAHLADQSTQAGWILGRFIDLDVLEPLPDYASAAGMRIVAYFPLNKVADAEGGSKPQYLVVGARGPEGQVCDFTVTRVFTWGAQRARYETAFVDSDLCGKLPVDITRSPDGDVTFAFQDFTNGQGEKREYRMHQTIVRRVGARTAAAPRNKRRR